MDQSTFYLFINTFQQLGVQIDFFRDGLEYEADLQRGYQPDVPVADESDKYSGPCNGGNRESFEAVGRQKKSINKLWDMSSKDDHVISSFLPGYAIQIVFCNFGFFIHVQPGACNFSPAHPPKYLLPPAGPNNIEKHHVKSSQVPSNHLRLWQGDYWLGVWCLFQEGQDASFPLSCSARFSERSRSTWRSARRSASCVTLRSNCSWTSNRCVAPLSNWHLGFKRLHTSTSFLGCLYHSCTSITHLSNMPMARIRHVWSTRRNRLDRKLPAF